MKIKVALKVHRLVLVVGGVDGWMDEVNCLVDVSGRDQERRKKKEVSS